MSRVAKTDLLESAVRHGEKKFEATRAPAVPSAPSPTMLVADAMSGLATVLRPRGFSGSARRLRRKTQDFECVLWLEKRRYNKRGVAAELAIAGSVHCRAIGHVRKEHHYPFGANDWVALGHNIGLLASPPRDIVWDLTDADGRDDTLSDLIATVETLALPFFGRFDDPERLASALLLETWNPHFRNSLHVTIESAIDLTHMFLGKVPAAELVARMLQQNPDWVDRVAECRARYVTGELPCHANLHPAEALALKTHAYGICA